MKFKIAIEAGAKKTAFGVVVPHLPGCLSARDAVEEATVPAVMLRRIDAHVEIHNVDSRSAFLVKAA